MLQDRPIGDRLLLAAAGLNGALAVAAGAFGAHAAQGQAAEWLGTGAFWQTTAALGGGVSVLSGARVGAAAFAAGGLIFAGALYGLALGGPSALGAVAPIGGVSLIAAWLSLSLHSWRRRAPAQTGSGAQSGERSGDDI